MLPDPHLPGWFWRVHEGTLQVGVERAFPSANVDPYAWMAFSPGRPPIFSPTPEREGVWAELTGDYSYYKHFIDAFGGTDFPESPL